MDYQERYLDMLQEGLRDIKRDLQQMGSDITGRLDRAESNLTGRMDRVEANVRGHLYASWSLVGVVAALVVATVIGVTQFAAQMFSLIPHK